MVSVTNLYPLSTNHSFIKHLLKAYPVSSKVLGEKKIKKHDFSEGIVMSSWRGQRHKKTDTTAQ